MKEPEGQGQDLRQYLNQRLFQSLMDALGEINKWGWLYKGSETSLAYFRRWICHHISRELRPHLPVAGMLWLPSLSSVLAYCISGNTPLEDLRSSWTVPTNSSSRSGAFQVDIETTRTSTSVSPTSAGSLLSKILLPRSFCLSLLSRHAGGTCPAWFPRRLRFAPWKELMRVVGLRADMVTWKS